MQSLDVIAQPAARRAFQPREDAQEVAATDMAAIQRFLGGDEKAFTEIFNRHRPRITHIVAGMLRDSAMDVEEVTQDTFIRAYRKLKDFRGDSSLATWLTCIAVNLARNRYWYWQRRKRDQSMSVDAPLTDEGTMTLGEILPGGEKGAAHLLTIEEFSRIVDECIGELSTVQRDILSMRNYQDLSYEEIAAILCIEFGTVKSRIARARDNLRALIAQRCPELASNEDIISMLVVRDEYVTDQSRRQ